MTGPHDGSPADPVKVGSDPADVLFLVRDSSAVVRDVESNPQVNAACSPMKAWVSLAGTAVGTVKAVTGTKDDDEGATVVQLP